MSYRFPVAHLFVLTILATSGHVMSAQPSEESGAASYPDIVSPTYDGHYRSVADSLHVQRQLELLYDQMMAAGASEAVDSLLARLIDTMRGSIVGGDHPDMVILLSMYGRRQLDRGNLEIGASILEEAVAGARRIYPGDHPAVPDILTNRAIALEVIGDPVGAVPLHQESLAMRRRIYGPLFDGAHLSLLTGVNNLAAVLHTVGETERAVVLMSEAVEIARRLYPEDHPDLARVFDNLAVLYDKTGRIDSAGALYARALEMRRRLFGREPHPDLLNSLSNVMLYRYERGDLSGARALMKEVISLARRIYPGDHPALASIYANCGGLASGMDQIELAEDLLHEAYRIAALSYDGAHPDKAHVLGNLGALALDRGRLEEAAVYTARAFDMNRELFGEMSTATITNRVNLSAIAREVRLWDRSEAYLDEALEIAEAELSEADPRYIALANNRAHDITEVWTLLTSVLDETEKEEMLASAIETLRKGLRALHRSESPDPFNVAVTTANLGTLFGLRGDIDSCLLLLEEGFDVIEKARSSGNLELAELMFNLAGTYERIGRISKSRRFYNRAIDLLSGRLLESTLYESEYEQIRFHDQWSARFDDYFSAMSRFVQEEPEVAREVFIATATRKGAVRDAAMLQRRIVTEQADHDTALADAWSVARKAKRELARLYNLEPTPHVTERIASLESEVKFAGKLLARASHQFDVLAPVEYPPLVERLSRNEAWVEFLRFRYYDRDQKTDTILYYALIALPSSEYPVMVRIGTEVDIARCISPGWFGENYVTDDPRNRTLYDLVWAPISPYLDDIEQVRLSPTGLISLISFGVLQDSTGMALIDSKELRYMNGARSFLEDEDPAPLSEVDDHTAVLFGGVLYSLGSASVAPEERLEYLPGTLAEVDSIRSMLSDDGWHVVTYVDTAASEEQLNRIEAPTVLHIATHGFFHQIEAYTTGIDVPLWEGERGSRGGTRADTLREAFEELSIHSDAYADGREEDLVAAAQEAGSYRSQMASPMLRSGLYLAGADRSLAGLDLPPDVEDGVATAYEIAGLDLAPTELVVLSACETGLGDVHGSEGVLGLPRAFQLAGADAVVMSLWPVPDLETVDLMRAFYRNLLEGQSTDDALRQAQRTMSASYPRSAWGAFIVVE